MLPIPAGAWMCQDRCSTDVDARNHHSPSVHPTGHHTCLYAWSLAGRQDIFQSAMQVITPAHMHTSWQSNGKFVSLQCGSSHLSLCM